MDDIRDDSMPAGESEPKPDDGYNPNAPEQPRWTVDAHGNLKGPIFSFPSDNLVIYSDEAITDPAELASLRKPKPGA